MTSSNIRILPFFTWLHQPCSFLMGSSFWKSYFIKSKVKKNCKDKIKRKQDLVICAVTSMGRRFCWNSELECGFIKTQTLYWCKIKYLNIKIEGISKQYSCAGIYFHFFLVAHYTLANIPNFNPEWENASDPCTQLHTRLTTGRRTTALPSPFCSHSKHPWKGKVLIELKCKLCEYKELIVYF